MSDCSSNQQQVHEYLQDVGGADPEEFQNLALALDIDAKEMEEEARIRLAQEEHLNLAAKQDEESIRLMKQALLLEKILANCGESSCDFPAAKVAQQPLINAMEPAGALEQTPSKAI